MPDPDSADILVWEPAQSKGTWELHKTRFVWKFTRKKLDAESADIILCEPAESKFTWTFHKSHCLDFFWENAGPQFRGHRFVRACAVEVHMDIAQEPFCVEIYKENAKRPGYHLD